MQSTVFCPPWWNFDLPGLSGCFLFFFLKKIKKENKSRSVPWHGGVGGGGYSVSQGAARKTAREKLKKARREEAKEERVLSLPLTAFFLFFRALFFALSPNYRQLHPPVNALVQNMFSPDVKRLSFRCLTLKFPRPNVKCRVRNCTLIFAQLLRKNNPA